MELVSDKFHNVETDSCIINRDGYCVAIRDMVYLSAEGEYWATVKFSDTAIVEMMRITVHKESGGGGHGSNPADYIAQLHYDFCGADFKIKLNKSGVKISKIWSSKLSPDMIFPEFEGLRNSTPVDDY